MVGVSQISDVHSVPQGVDTQMSSAGFIWTDLQHISRQLQTEDIAWSALKQSPLAAALIRQDLLTRDMCEFFVSQDPKCFLYVPHHLQDVDMCLKGALRNGLALEYMAPEFLTDEVIQAAIKNKPWALDTIPEPLKNQEYCALALSGDIATVEVIPKEFLTFHTFFRAAELNSSFLSSWTGIKLGSDSNAKLNLRLAMVSFSWRELAKVPVKEQTKEMCEIALEQDIDSINLMNTDIFEKHIAPIINKKHADLMAAIVDNAFDSQKEPGLILASEPRI